MDNLNLITSDFVFSGNFDGCLPQKVGVSAPVLKRNGPVGTVRWLVLKMDNLNLITSDFVFSGNFDGCLPQKVGVSAPVLKRNGPVGTVHGGKNGGIGCIAGQKTALLSPHQTSLI